MLNSLKCCHGTIYLPTVKWLNQCTPGSFWLNKLKYLDSPAKI